jgi:hypothetical protein
MKDLNENQVLKSLLIQFFTQITEWFGRLMLALDEIKKELNPAPSSLVEVWLSEEEARKLINRGRTWFYRKRKDGSLTHTYVGSEPRYLRESILSFIERNRKDAYRKE